MGNYNIYSFNMPEKKGKTSNCQKDLTKGQKGLGQKDQSQIVLHSIEDQSLILKVERAGRIKTLGKVMYQDVHEVWFSEESQFVNDSCFASIGNQSIQSRYRAMTCDFPEFFDSPKKSANKHNKEGDEDEDRLYSSEKLSNKND